MTGIPLRSTRRARGQLQGAAPTARQVQRVQLLVEQLDGGMYRLTSPQMPGWVATARTAHELALAHAKAFTEAQIASYSRWKGNTYDSPVRHKRHRPKVRGKSRCDVYDPREWQIDPDTGKWVSPKGLKYPENTQVVQRVIAQRIGAGLPPSPDPNRPPSKETLALVASTMQPRRDRGTRKATPLPTRPSGEPARTATTGKFQLARRADPKWEPPGLLEDL